MGESQSGFLKPGVWTLPLTRRSAPAGQPADPNFDRAMKVIRSDSPIASYLERMVFEVGVDLGLCLEDEPRLARLLDDVTGSGARVRTLGRTVLFDGGECRPASTS
jgi:hypothetical protein